MIEKKTKDPLLLCRHGDLSGIRAGKWSGEAPLDLGGDHLRCGADPKTLEPVKELRRFALDQSSVPPNAS
jgi:hypothetical protein